MPYEIERKFLVKTDAYKSISLKKHCIKQGFLNIDPQRTVRVRTKGDEAFLTIKGIGNESGMKRYELEKKIEKNEAEELFNICIKPLIEKIRYEVEFENHIFEIDEFLGDNKGLVIAEVELKDENERVLLPDFIGKEVTGDIRYYNLSLVKDHKKTCF